MANNKENPDHIPRGLLVGLGVAAGAGALLLLIRALRPTAKIIEDGVKSVVRGARDAADAVADAITGAKTAAEVVERTNAILVATDTQLRETTDELARARLSLVRLEAAKAEAIALGSPFGLQPSIDGVRARIATLEAA